LWEAERFENWMGIELKDINSPEYDERVRVEVEEDIVI
jgi:hypothetical protein